MDNPLGLLLHPIIAPALGGVLTHVVCYHHEPSSLTAFAAIFFFPPLAIAVALTSGLSISSFVWTAFIYDLALAISITTYRLSPFHPLAKYPGPVLARVSRFWAAGQVLGGNQHIVSHSLFEKYGDAVRTGPNHLILRNASAISVIHGPKDRWPRHARYAIGREPDSHGALLGIIQPADHSKRRRIWDRAFTPSAIQMYEPMLSRRVEQFMNNLNSRCGESLDLAKWFGFFSLDFMGDFAYGGMFDFMARGADTEGFHDFTVLALGMVEVCGTIPWVAPIVLALPASSAMAFQEMAMRVVEKRRKGGSQVRDLFHYLLNEDGVGNYPDMNDATLRQEASLAIIAGSDTTSTALSNAMYYLLCHRHVLHRLRAELDGVAGEGVMYDVPVDHDRLATLPYLQAVINETLRLQPVLPNGIQRTAPHKSGVIDVAGYLVPPGTSVQIPTWSIHRDPRYFSPNPEEFWPERWLPGEGPKIAEARAQKFKLFQGAYMPFHYGPANCVGRSLALHEMRTVLAAVIRRFDIEFAPGFGKDDWLKQLKDQYVLVRGKLPVVLNQRK